MTKPTKNQINQKHFRTKNFKACNNKHSKWAWKER